MMYKFLRLVDGEIVSQYGNQTWEIGKEYNVEGEIKLCENGFHCSETPLDAFPYVQGEILAIVEVGGDCNIEEGKAAYRIMKIVKAYRWTKTDSVELAIFCAEKVLPVFAAKYPNDNRPCKAIEAAKKWLGEPTEENRQAAYAAADAAARAAVDAADYAAARAAYAAARAAYAAADAAAYAAAYAAVAAVDAAADAARAAIRSEINQWILNRIELLEVIEGS